MGQAKKEWLEQENKGYYDSVNRSVCSCHFEDHYIKTFIEENSSEGKCHYCSKNGNVIDLPTLREFISEKIRKYYGDIEDQALPSANSWLDKDDEANFPYHDSCGLLMPNERDDYDIDELFEKIELNIDNKKLYNDIRNYFDDTKRYCLVDALYDTKEEELSYKWEQFCKKVKSSRRYTFFKMPEFTTKQHSDNGLDNILSELENAVINANLISTLKPNVASLCRCRVHKKNELINTIDNLASPPDNCASQNRMSPAGISMFYGAFYPKTAVTEVANTFNDENDVITIGDFNIIKPIKVVNFTGLFHLSIFCDYDYNVMSFLKAFIFEIAKPITKKYKDIEYIPTQIITEYFRYVFKTKEQENINGLIYRSAANKGGVCCVLFFDKKTCPKYLSLAKYAIIVNKDKIFEELSRIDWIDTTELLRI
jgi:hypothetical protein